MGMGGGGMGMMGHGMRGPGGGGRGGMQAGGPGGPGGGGMNGMMMMQMHQEHQQVMMQREQAQQMQMMQQMLAQSATLQQRQQELQQKRDLRIARIKQRKQQLDEAKRAAISRRVSERDSNASQPGTFVQSRTGSEARPVRGVMAGVCRQRVIAPPAAGPDGIVTRGQVLPMREGEAPEKSPGLRGPADQAISGGLVLPHGIAPARIVVELPVSLNS